MQFRRFWSNVTANVLQVLLAIDIALALALVVVLGRSTAEEFRKLRKG